MRKPTLFTLAFLMIFNMAFATDTVNITVSANLTPSINLTWVPATSAIDLTKAANLDQSLGTLSYTTNTTNGLSFLVTSSKLGILKHSTSTTKGIYYSLKVASPNLATSTGVWSAGSYGAPVTINTSHTSSASPVGSGSLALSVNYPAMLTDGLPMISGDYSDTLTITASSR